VRWQLHERQLPAGRTGCFGKQQRIELRRLQSGWFELFELLKLLELRWFGLLLRELQRDAPLEQRLELGWIELRQPGELRRLVGRGGTRCWLLGG
jgi:hypothetical protein